MPETDMTETPEQQLAHWMPSIQKYLDELKSPNPNFALVAYARTKFPFLDWVLSGKEPIEFFTPLPAEPPPIEIPFEIESPGFPKPKIVDTSTVYELLLKIARKLEVPC